MQDGMPQYCDLVIYYTPPIMSAPSTDKPQGASNGHAYRCFFINISTIYYARLKFYEEAL